MATQPYCVGTDCPLAATCDRFKSDIDPKQHVQLSYVPFRRDTGKCAFYIRMTETQQWLANTLKALNDADQNKD